METPSGNGAEAGRVIRLSFFPEFSLLVPAARLPPAKIAAHPKTKIDRYKNSFFI
jgi:hypothetical protein